MAISTTFAVVAIVSALAASAAEESSAQNFALNITSYVSIIVALIALLGTFITRKVKSPADELARADFAYKKISERLEEVNKDRTYLQSVIDTLREQLTKLDDEAFLSIEDKRKLRLLIAEGEQRINQLLDENRVLQERLSSIAEKVRRGLPITLSDVYGESTNVQTPRLEDIELTISPADLQAMKERGINRNT